MGPLSATMRRVIDGLEQALAQYPSAWSDDATIAFSGGKDSIALAAALAASGRNVRLRAVDMGYSAEWTGRIRAIAEALNQDVEIVSVRELARPSNTASPLRRDLASRRAFLDRIEVAAPNSTPCTNCYNCKVLSLVDAVTSVGVNLLFGHHATDALSSFLKAAIMYLDRWKEGHVTFNREAYRALGLRYVEQLRVGRRNTINELLYLLESGKAQTSEPPVERRQIHGRNYSIGRPLYFVSELDTLALTNELAVRPERSGCGHTVAAATRTPREIIHHEAIPLIRETPEGRSALSEIFEAMSASLALDGTVRHDVRNSRHVLLGGAYKGDGTGLTERL